MRLSDSADIGHRACRVFKERPEHQADNSARASAPSGRNNVHRKLRRQTNSASIQPYGGTTLSVPTASRILYKPHCRRRLRRARNVHDVDTVGFTPPFAFHHQEGRQRRSAKGEGRSVVSSLPPATALVTSCLCATAAVACMKHGCVRRMPSLLHRSKHQRCPRTPLVLSVCTMTRHDRWAVAAIAQQQ